VTQGAAGVQGCIFITTKVEMRSDGTPIGTQAFVILSDYVNISGNLVTLTLQREFGVD
jgi:hypothetical protein